MAVVTRVRISEPTIFLIYINFIKRLNERIYNWYVDGDHLLLRFILGRGAFRNDINDKCILCKNSDNSQEHVVNECAKTEKINLKNIIIIYICYSF